MRILGTGLSGLIGSRLVELLKNQHEFENLSLQTGTDITDRKDVAEKIYSSKASIVIHFAAKTNVDECEKDKEKDLRVLSSASLQTANQEEALIKQKTAWAVNVIGTRNIVEACKKSQKRLIYISTDFVFDGEKQLENGYVESDKPKPINWYAKTKYEGEKIIQHSDTVWAIARLAYPYRAYFVQTDFVRSLIEKLKKGEKLMTITDHIMTPTFIDDIVEAINILLNNQPAGIFHIVGSQFISPYEASLLIADVFGLDRSLISKTTRAEYFKNRAPRPFFLGLKNDKIQKLGIKMKTFKEGLIEIKRQMSSVGN